MRVLVLLQVWSKCRHIYSIFCGLMMWMKYIVFTIFICSCCTILGPDLCWFFCAWPYKNHSYKNHFQPLRELHLFSQQQWEDNIVTLNGDIQFSFSELKGTSERGESLAGQKLLYLIYFNSHACASCWFLWYRYSVSDKVVKRLFLWQFCCHRTTIHLWKTCSVGSCFHSFHILGNYK